MVEPQHLIAAKFQHPRQRVANDRGAQVPHMHFLGDVGAGEIHNHRRQPAALGPWLLGGAAYPQARILEPAGHLRRQPLGLDREIDKARPGDLGPLAEVAETGGGLQLLHQGRGNYTRLHPQPLGQGQGAIGLEITEFRLAGRAQLRIQGAALGRSRGCRSGEGLL